MLSTNRILHWPNTDKLSISKQIVIIVTIEVFDIFVFDAFSVIPNEWNRKFVVPLCQNFRDFRVIKNLFSLFQFKILINKLVLTEFFPGKTVPKVTVI